MSLSDKEKEIAFAHAKDWIEEGTTDEQLLMFVDLFLSGIREEQEAVGYITTDEYGDRYGVIGAKVDWQVFISMHTI